MNLHDEGTDHKQVVEYTKKDRNEAVGDFCNRKEVTLSLNVTYHQWQYYVGVEHRFGTGIIVVKKKKT